MNIRSILSTLCLLAAASLAQAQPRPQAVRTELPFRVLSAERVDFAKPLRFAGPAGKPIRLERAFLVRLEVPAADYGAMSGGMEPFLYIGTHELRPFAVERAPGNGRALSLTYFSREAPPDEALRSGAPMVLTLDHGAPQREPKRFMERRDLQRFKPEWLQASKP